MPTPRVLIPAADIQRRVRELGSEIGRECGPGPVYLIGVLKGSFIFLADLVRAIDTPVRVDFIGAASYGAGTESSGQVRITKDLDASIEGCDVIVVEDIVDTGLTLAYLRSILLARHPVSVEVCTLLDRAVRRIAPLDIRYVGFDCPDLFVVGYGLDLDQHHRNIPHVVAVEDVAAAQADPTCLDRFLPGAPVPLAAHDVPE